jgi:hypothetical protein
LILWLTVTIAKYQEDGNFITQSVIESTPSMQKETGIPRLRQSDAYRVSEILPTWGSPGSSKAGKIGSTQSFLQELRRIE